MNILFKEQVMVYAVEEALHPDKATQMNWYLA